MRASGNNSPFEPMTDDENLIIQIMAKDAVEGDGSTLELGMPLASLINTSAAGSVVTLSTSMENELPISQSASSINLVTKTFLITGE